MIGRWRRSRPCRGRAPSWSSRRPSLRRLAGCCAADLSIHAQSHHNRACQSDEHERHAMAVGISRRGRTPPARLDMREDVRPSSSTASPSRIFYPPRPGATLQHGMRRRNRQTPSIGWSRSIRPKSPDWLDTDAEIPGDSLRSGTPLQDQSVFGVWPVSRTYTLSAT